MKKVFKYFLLCGLGFSTISLQAQDTFTEEVSSLDNIITALYASISGEKGEPRQWEMFHSLFTENAQLVPTGKNAEGIVGFRSWTPKQYEEQANEWLVGNGFHETETFRVSESYGPVTHIFSTYDSRNSIKDEKPFARGINSIQLFNDGTRWWIMTIYWSSETAENPIPSKYLRK